MERGSWKVDEETGQLIPLPQADSVAEERKQERLRKQIEEDLKGTGLYL